MMRYGLAGTLLAQIIMHMTGLIRKSAAMVII